MARAPSIIATEAPHVREQHALMRSLLLTVHHFFGSFQSLFRYVSDPRDPAYITYSLPALLTAGVCPFLFRLGARRQANLLLRANHPACVTFHTLFGVQTWPHGDTLNATYARLDVSEVQEVVTASVAQLIRAKVLYRYRLLNRYFLVAIDGTGVLTFAERHCPHCLTTTRHGHTIYYHPVLEAKLVTYDGLVCSLMTEFIENPDDYPCKQDCELKAFYRLAHRLKQRFPQLPLCLLLDGLFANGPTFSLCAEAGWKFIITLQEGDLPTLHEEFDALLPFFPAQHLHFRPADAYPVTQEFTWVNEISYTDSARRAHTLAVIRCLETKGGSTAAPHVTRYQWVTNLPVTDRNVIQIANQGGRLRWKIENEGFNVQKNGGYALEHTYSHHPVAAKVFYLLLQLAHTLAQLIERSSLLRQAFPSGLGAARTLAWRLLEAWRNVPYTADLILPLLNARIQIRLRPP